MTDTFQAFGQSPDTDGLIIYLLTLEVIKALVAQHVPPSCATTRICVQRHFVFTKLPLRTAHYSYFSII